MQRAHTIAIGNADRWLKRYALGNRVPSCEAGRRARRGACARRPRSQSAGRRERARRSAPGSISRQGGAAGLVVIGLVQVHPRLQEGVWCSSMTVCLRGTNGEHALAAAFTCVACAQGREGPVPVPLGVVPNDIGHSSIATTSGYLTQERTNALRAVECLWGANFRLRTPMRLLAMWLEARGARDARRLGGKDGQLDRRRP